MMQDGTELQAQTPENPVYLSTDEPTQSATITSELNIAVPELTVSTYLHPAKLLRTFPFAYS